jgi:formylglycine-generating enzyme required for sulfatase activity
VTANAQWQQVSQDFAGVTMVFVPVGCFTMGTNDGQENEKPTKQQCVTQPFWIDKFEVSNGQFAQFGGTAGESSLSTGANRPRERITWFAARDFCAARGARLPTEVEWEYAARGPDNLMYPWGNRWNDNFAVWLGNSNDQSADVGSRPGDTSWVGVSDMSGNVGEWVSSLYAPYPYTSQNEDENDNRQSRVIRGGSWNFVTAPELEKTSAFRTVYRTWFEPQFSDTRLGFRCVRP